MKYTRLPLVCLACALAFAGCARESPSASEAARPAAAASAAPVPPASVEVPTEKSPGAVTELPSSLRAPVGTMGAAAALRAMDEASRLLEDTLGASAPDCGTVRLLRDRICELSLRLCQLADRTSGSELTARCQDGRTRCERAKTRVAGPCG